MSNKDYYGQPQQQQQYYPPSGAVFLHDPYICNVTDEGVLAGPPQGQGGYYPQQPQQAYQGGYGGQPGYQPQPQPQAVYV
jgi:hypothetical protein